MALRHPRPGTFVEEVLRPSMVAGADGIVVVFVMLQELWIGLQEEDADLAVPVLSKHHRLRQPQLVDGAVFVQLSHRSN